VSERRVLLALPRSLWRSAGRWTTLDASSAYATQAADAPGGGRSMYLASFLKFWAVATSKTSSRAPLKPLSRNRSSCRGHPAQLGFSCTTLPPTIVISAVTSRIAISSTLSGSALSTARSASLPASSEPFFPSSKVR